MFVKWAKWQITHLQNLWNNKNVALFIVFLFISTTFWFLNSLRKYYNTTIYIPIELENLPDGKMVNQEATGNLALLVRGDGFSLLRFKIGHNKDSIKIDVNRIKRFKFGQKNRSYILTSDYKQEISSQLSQDFELIGISPDTLVIGLQNRKTKTVPIKLNTSLQYKFPLHQSGQMVIIPNTVEVSGPDVIMDTLSAVYTVYKVYDNISDTLFTELDINRNEKLSYSVDKIDLTIPVEAYTESKFKVPLQIIGTPNGLNIKTFPSEIDMSCLVALSQFEKITKNQFVAIVDVTDLDLENLTKLKVKIESAPAFVYSVKFEPLFIDFLLERY